MTKERMKIIYGPHYVTNEIRQPKAGDILFSDIAIPTGEVVYWKDLDKKKDHIISIACLRDYLELLELLVLNNRVIIGHQPTVETRLTPKEWDNEDIRILLEMESSWFKVPGLYSLLDQLQAMVNGKDTIIEAIVIDEAMLPPDQLVDTYLPIDQALQNEHKGHIEQAKYIGVTDKNVASNNIL